MTDPHEWTDDSPTPPEGKATAPATSNRRSFLKQVGKKAVYVTPVVMTLAASEAHAGSGVRSWCGDVGSPCAVLEDCCPGLMCIDMLGMGTCQ
jgi:hypothetical protein